MQKLPRGAANVLKFYNWAYVNPRAVRFFDRDICVSTILWFQQRSLWRAVFSELPATSGPRSVLQANSVYGSYLPRLAAHVGPGTRLSVRDVIPIQVDRARAKLARFPWATAELADAEDAPRTGAHDVAISYFLLHEADERQKRAITDALLETVKPDGGKVIFIDYHRMARWHPLRPVCCCFPPLPLVLLPFHLTDREHPVHVARLAPPRAIRSKHDSPRDQGFREQATDGDLDQDHDVWRPLPEGRRCPQRGENCKGDRSLKSPFSPKKVTTTSTHTNRWQRKRSRSVA